ncbi:GGDEF domain-containing protein [Idiomarina seosinensis]|uniref:GGDEF domain-containing protein n=1 Tax=Idiomarina seosinensis TaxID=281739 RepID=UPI00384F3D4B
MFTFWFKTLPDIPTRHPDYYRAILIYYLLLFLITCSALLAILNQLIFSAPRLALIDISLVFAGLGIYWFFRTTAKVTLVSWLVTLILTLAIAVYLTLWSGNNFGVVWATIVPPIAFFLLGRQWGTLVSVVLFSYVGVIVYRHVLNAEAFVLGFGGVLNVVEVLLAQVLLFRFYEKNRASAIKQLQENRQQLEKLANTDKLTGLNNRQKFDQELNQEIQRAAQTGQPLSLLLIDIDHFKQLNDSKGHLFGDAVLCHLAKVLTVQVRKQDTLARWGGEEFVALMPDTSQSEAQQLAERLRQRVADEAFDETRITVSCGVALLSGNGKAESLIATADRALYQAKQRGRNCVVTA